MSKSRGNVVDPFTVMKEYGVDTIRYYLMRDGGISDDGGRILKLFIIFLLYKNGLTCVLFYSV